MSEEPFAYAQQSPAAAQDSPTAAPHPEEMRGTFELRFGDRMSMKATARATPAGLAAAALLLAAIFVPMIWWGRTGRAR